MASTTPREELALRRPGHSVAAYDAALNAAENLDRAVRGLLNRGEKRLYEEAKKGDGTYEFKRLWHPDIRSLVDELHGHFPWFPTEKCGNALGHAWSYWHLR